ncbi:transcription initiation factor TFIID subunit 4b isoform X2 [Cajanus cajan]|uniref:transcription initiation factor TFIID subunit 4b isoform X2 n=1 Tax=Cajanus cajan TaxID=3821 RepID=UPI00098D8435|nr:transcription initiation factor TFIID subunit 4b isoform X2 [Cajanus cajan]
MDPSIVKLLEDDEDETMHSGADVEAFQAALNRDIGGDASTSQLSGSDTGSNNSLSQSLPKWPTSTHDNQTDCQNQEPKVVPQQEQQHSSEMELKQQPLVEQLQNVASQDANNLPSSQKQSQDESDQDHTGQAPHQNSQTNGVQNSEKDPVFNHEVVNTHNPNHESQYAKLQQMSNQQATVNEQPSSQVNRNKQVPFAMLLPMLIPQLAKDRAMQLQTLFNKLKKDEIPKDHFVRLMKGIVGDQMLRLALTKVQLQTRSNPGPSGQQHPVRMPNVNSGATKFNDPHALAQLHQRSMNAVADQSHNTSAVQMKNEPTYPTVDINAKKSRELDVQVESQGVPPNQLPSSSSNAVSQETERSSLHIQGLNKEQQQHLHFPSAYGSSGGNYSPFLGSTSSSTSSLRPQHHVPHQSISSNQLGGVTQGLIGMTKFDQQNSFNEPKRMPGGYVSPMGSSANQGTLKEEFSRGLPASTSMPHTTSSSQPLNSASSSVSQLDHGATLSSQIPSNTSGIHARTPLRKPSPGQKKPIEALGSSPPPPSKKQKVSGASLEPSIEQLNDVTAVSGVDLREEEEQLFSGSKEDSRVSEASRRVVQEEEESLILQKAPLQRKLIEIITECGLKGMSNDLEKCLSLVRFKHFFIFIAVRLCVILCLKNVQCVEERMRGVISNMIRMSKQRVDLEKTRHQTVVTSDVRQQIMTMNRKAREEWEKKQAETEKLRKQNDVEGNAGMDGDKEKDDGRMKSTKVNKEVDDKMRTNAANVAARAAVGGDDMLSKWQLMAEQARQKREGGMDASSGSQPAKDVGRKSSSTSGRSTKDNQAREKKGAAKKLGRNHSTTPQTSVARSISIKDVIAVLEREPQMSKSSLIYRLYERIHSDTSTE